ncbi:hypothetical protein CVM73_34410 [Bradyrhizobium forestalis]|uniref:Uncharacterized protein n=1 Tax=Bradyrhizobium forestalis TaxID=1419263 RepID=A0A2M8QZ01_9BRAD|nr:hypothetical protein CVM73_34410 [Bradyrhizobium forestalis]
MAFLGVIVAGICSAVATKAGPDVTSQQCHILRCQRLAPLSSPAKAGDPVRRGPSVQSQPSRSTGSPGPSAQLRTGRAMTVESEDGP